MSFPFLDQTAGGQFSSISFTLFSGASRARFESDVVMDGAPFQVFQLPVTQSIGCIQVPDD